MDVEATMQLRKPRTERATASLLPMAGGEGLGEAGMTAARQHVMPRRARDDGRHGASSVRRAGSGVIGAGVRCHSYRRKT